jgi:hypothetical protein
MAPILLLKTVVSGDPATRTNVDDIVRDVESRNSQDPRPGTAEFAGCALNRQLLRRHARGGHAPDQRNRPASSHRVRNSQGATAIPACDQVHTPIWRVLLGGPSWDSYLQFVTERPEVTAEDGRGGCGVGSRAGLALPTRAPRRRRVTVSLGALGRTRGGRRDVRMASSRRPQGLDGERCPTPPEGPRSVLGPPHAILVGHLFHPLHPLATGIPRHPHDLDHPTYRYQSRTARVTAAVPPPSPPPP